jgi:hypothetical protein
MQLPEIFKGNSPVRLAQGAAAGAIAAVVIGFSFGGWMLGGTAQKMADKSANNALVSALAPICVDKFQHASGAQTTLVELKAVDSWRRDSFVEKGGWATLPGMERPNRDVAEACAKLLDALK